VAGRATGGWSGPAAAAGTVLILPLLPSLPPLWLIPLTAAAGLALSLRPRLRWGGVCLLALAWSLHVYHVRLEDRLDPGWAGEVVSVLGTISSVPESREAYSRFRFDPAADERQRGLPRTLLVYWYRDRPDLAVGQLWDLELRLKPPWGAVNFHGRDPERWLFAAGIGGVATVRAGQLQAAVDGPALAIESLRARVNESIAGQVASARARGIVQALATADRSALTDRDRRILTLTGTAHLLAISGLHIGLAAVAGVWLGRLLFALLPLARSGRLTLLGSLLTGLGIAASYAALAGFGVATQRAVLMLTVVMVALAASRPVHPMRGWLVALVAILLLDPLAPLAAGFWFSFVAVGALLMRFVPLCGARAGWKTLLLAQSAVMLVLLPVSAMWFSGFSLGGFGANLVAIPWVSFTVVPLVLAGVASLPFSTGLAGVFWTLAGIAAEFLMGVLEQIARLPAAWVAVAPPSLAGTVLAAVGAALLLLPRVTRLRGYGALMVLALCLPPGKQAETGSLLLEVLDAGQGTAAIVSTAGRTLLYDSGPGDGDGRDLVGTVIMPALSRLGWSAPERVVVSHGDLDHAGGLASLLERYPRADYRVNMPGADYGCLVPQQWDWAGARFTVLHPSRGLPYLGNESSCAISVRSARASLLLSGDISSVIESRLVHEGLRTHDVLLVPHHGSESSSSPDFLAALAPRYAIATAALGNRFDFPREAVRARYRGAGVTFWSTGACGALRLRLAADGSVEARSARRSRPRIWRWPAGEECP
jgi:competence protein ComEC